MNSSNTFQKQARDCFNEFELHALDKVCEVLGRDMEDIPVPELRHLRDLFYSAPKQDRYNSKMAQTRLTLCNMLLSTLQRVEFTDHYSSPEYRESFLRLLITGDEHTQSIQQTIDLLLLTLAEARNHE